MNGDPKKFKNAIKLDALSYTHAIEMAYYGATVIHPKTIQPLQSKHIPLYVKSFINPKGKGTTVSTTSKEKDIPTYISKTNQVLLSVSSKDFSFIVEDNLSGIFATLAKHRININLMQNSAISFSICVDNKPEKLALLKKDLSELFVVRSNENVELLTVMHYEEKALKTIMGKREILLEQRTRTGVQFVIK